MKECLNCSVYEPEVASHPCEFHIITVKIAIGDWEYNLRSIQLRFKHKSLLLLLPLLEQSQSDSKVVNWLQLTRHVLL